MGISDALHHGQADAAAAMMDSTFKPSSSWALLPRHAALRRASSPLARRSGQGRQSNGNMMNAGIASASARTRYVDHDVAG